MATKIDVTMSLKQLDGVTDLLDDDGKLLTLRRVLSVAYVTRAQNESMDAAEQVDRFVMARKVTKDDEIELSSGQITKLKEYIAKRYMPLVTGQVCLILEGELDEPTEES